ncbi:MAG: ribonuclease P protein component [Bacteroidota bacterium]
MIISRSERLKRRKYIEALFKKGNILNLYPLRMVYLPCSTLSSHQVLFAVPSKRVRRAVIRNKIKRRMREAYRLHKHCLSSETNVYFLIGYIYTGTSELCDFKALQKRIVSSFRYLSKLPIQDYHDSSKA